MVRVCIMGPWDETKAEPHGAGGPRRLQLVCQQPVTDAGLPTLPEGNCRGGGTCHLQGLQGACPWPVRAESVRESGIGRLSTVMLSYIYDCTDHDNYS